MGNLGYQAHGVAVVGTPSIMILQEATTLRSDLILMGTRGRQGITRFVLGSVSHKVYAGCWRFTEEMGGFPVKSCPVVPDVQIIGFQVCQRDFPTVCYN